MDLVGLDGLPRINGLGVVDAGSIAQDELLRAIKSLPEGNAVALLQRLPENIITKICTEGANEKITAYLPTAIVGLGGGVVAGLMTNSFVTGLLVALIAGGTVYFITQPASAKA